MPSRSSGGLGDGPEKIVFREHRFMSSRADPQSQRLSLGTLHGGQVAAYWALNAYRFKGLGAGGASLRQRASRHRRPSSGMNVHAFRPGPT